MISVENLPFCTADSNKYIGFINPHVYGFSSFPTFASNILDSLFSRKSFSIITF